MGGAAMFVRHGAHISKRSTKTVAERRAVDYQRHREWRAQQKRHRHNPVDIYPVPLDRTTQWLLGITDEDRKNRKQVGAALAKIIREAVPIKNKF